MLYALKWKTTIFLYIMQTWCRHTQWLFANLPTPQNRSLKPSILTVSLQHKTGRKEIATIGPFPGTFRGSVELSYTPTITILFLNLLAIYLAISSPPVIPFGPLCLSAHLYFSHIPTQQYTFKSLKDNRQPWSVFCAFFLSLTHCLTP